MKGRRFGVVDLILSTGEELPVLIDRQTGLPPILPLRWATTHRRNEAAPATLRTDLQGVAELYEWGFSTNPFRPDLFEVALTAGTQFSHQQLAQVIEFVRTKRFLREGRRSLRSPTTVSLRLQAISAFLRWTANPRDRGSPIVIPAGELIAYEDRVSGTIRPYLDSGSKRPDPLTAQQDGLLR